MEKLKLNLDDLKVESFDTLPEQMQHFKGAIYGYGLSDHSPCNTDQNTCAPFHTCGLCTGQNTCNNLCTGGCTGDCDPTAPTCLCW